MDPLRVDGLPVRAAAGLKELAARWDARASAATVVGPEAPARVGARPAARRVAPASDKTEKGRAAAQGSARGPRRAPREASERQELVPEVMGYGPNGWVIPLPEEGASLAGRGVDLDFYA